MGRIQRFAGKDHICRVCGRVIYAGTEYIVQHRREKSRNVTYKLHRHCDALLLEAEQRQQMDVCRLCGEMRGWVAQEACARCGTERCGVEDIISCPLAVAELVPKQYIGPVMKSLLELDALENARRG